MSKLYLNQHAMQKTRAVLSKMYHYY